MTRSSVWGTVVVRTERSRSQRRCGRGYEQLYCRVERNETLKSHIGDSRFVANVDRRLRATRRRTETKRVRASPRQPLGKPDADGTISRRVFFPPPPAPPPCRREKPSRNRRKSRRGARDGEIFPEFSRTVLVRKSGETFGAYPPRRPGRTRRGADERPFAPRLVDGNSPNPSNGAFRAKFSVFRPRRRAVSQWRVCSRAGRRSTCSPSRTGRETPKRRGPEFARASNSRTRFRVALVRRRCRGLVPISSSGWRSFVLSR